MCGIAGIFGGSLQKEESREILIKMISALQHRGPDGLGIYLAPVASLGHSRLSIVDPQLGDQPMVTDNVALSYNGEVYNYIELREELIALGYRFNTNSDTEVVLRSYEHYGEDCFSRFNGQFAILIYDKRSKHVIAARDRFGIRPLYVFRNQGKVYFSSEVKSFDPVPGFNRDINIQNLGEHALLWNTLGNSTIYNDITSVEPGTYEIFTSASADCKTVTYYQIGETFSGYSKNSFDEEKNSFAKKLTDSVNIRLMGDVEIGAYLSGGIDSSVVTYLANHLKQKKLKKEPLKTFSVAFENKDFDESEYQLMMQKQLQSKHFVEEITNKSISKNFEDVIYHGERPVFRTAPTPLFLLSQKVNKNKLKAVLTGEGADEILFGYDSFKELKLLEFWGRDKSSSLRPLLLKKLYPHLKHYNDPRKFGLMKMFYEGFLDRQDSPLLGLGIRVHNNQAIFKYFNKDHNLQLDMGALENKVVNLMPKGSEHWSMLQKNQFLEIKTLLQGYLLSSQGDRMSNAHSVEGRFPFLDHNFVEYIFSLPDKYKLNGFNQKYILKEAFRHKIPAEIIDRPKRPYTAPDLLAFHNGNKLCEFAEHHFSDESLDNAGLFDKKIVRRFLKKIARNPSEAVGYRDNMVFTFMLSTQILKSIDYKSRSNIKVSYPLKVEICEF